MRIASAAAGLCVGLALMTAPAMAEQGFPSGQAGEGKFELFPRWQRVLAETRPARSPLIGKAVPAPATAPAAQMAPIKDATETPEDALTKPVIFHLPLPAARRPWEMPDLLDLRPLIGKGRDCRQQGGCAPGDWQRIIHESRPLSRQAQLEKLNGWANGIRYVEDSGNWGIPDYWQTPAEFLARGGDCEDYAILKYFGLTALGFDPADIRIMVLYDEELKLHHAVLLVRLDGEIWLLDNQREEVARLKDAPHYRPIYSVNEDNWWMHRQPQALRFAPVKKETQTARYTNRPQMTLRFR